jgi:hypothetical protein
MSNQPGQEEASALEVTDFCLQQATSGFFFYLQVIPCENSFYGKEKPTKSLKGIVSETFDILVCNIRKVGIVYTFASYSF